MGQRIIAIGDVHGCNIALRSLLSAISPQSDDIIVMLGDYIDRGPDSRGVIDTLIELATQTQLVALMGNHEEMMLDVLAGRQPHHGWLKYGGMETLESYGFTGDLDFLPPEHATFLDTLGDYFVMDNYLFTHAAYDPVQPFNTQPIELLRWHSLRSGVPDPHYSGMTAVVGHTANHEGNILDVGHLICLDTYCYGGGWLTAMDLPTRRTWQVNQSGQLRR